MEVLGLKSINANVKVSNITGKLIGQYDMKTSNKEIDISELPQGIYILKYTDERGSASVRVVKK